VYLKNLVQKKEVEILSPLTLIFELQKEYMIEQRCVKFTRRRLISLLNAI